MEENFIEMDLREIQTPEDPRNTPIIVLAEKQGTREFPIFIGHLEARLLENVVLHESTTDENRRPLTHDLAINLIDSLRATLRRVLVTRLEDSTFYGALEVESDSGNILRIDSRPSDAIILAMKRRVPIFVEAQVINAALQGSETEF